MAAAPNVNASAAKAEVARRWPFLGAMLVLVGVFLALSTWQVQRLFWKLALIERVEARIHATPVPLPPFANAVAVDPEREEYKRVTITGRFRQDAETLVQAVTDLGPGFWVMTPLDADDGTTVLVNRGFVPPDRRGSASHAAGLNETQITGLLRLSEPGGGFLRANDPANDRWYSRDVAAIASSKNLGTVAPIFIDADATPNPGGFPVGGLTVVRFRNSHLVYAFTWYGLAVMTAGTVLVLRRRRLI